MIPKLSRVLFIICNVKQFWSITFFKCKTHSWHIKNVKFHNKESKDWYFLLIFLLSNNWYFKTSILAQCIANTEEKIGSFWYFYKSKTTVESASLTATLWIRWYSKMDARTLKAKESIENRPHKQNLNRDILFVTQEKKRQ